MNATLADHGDVSEHIQNIHVSLLEVEGSGTHGITEVCADAEMGSRVLGGLYTDLMWAHLAFFLMHNASQVLKSWERHNLS